MSSMAELRGFTPIGMLGYLSDEVWEYGTLVCLPFHRIRHIGDGSQLSKGIGNSLSVIQCLILEALHNAPTGLKAQ